MSNKTGLFGITANPPHAGHRMVIEEALKQCQEVWVSPVFLHPFGKSFIAYESRMEMLEMLVDGIEGNVHVRELDKDFYEKFGKTPYSYELLSHMKSEHGVQQPALVIGQDNYMPEVWSRFYNHQKIEDEFSLVIVPDSGSHSTGVRQACRADQWSVVQELCGKEIAQYIKHNGFYQD